MCILGGLLFMWGIVPNFLFAVSVAVSQKNPDFGTPKMEHTLFVGRNRIGLRGIPSPSQGPRACPIWPRFNKLCHDQGQV
jgi:hypothetical protein